MIRSREVPCESGSMTISQTFPVKDRPNPNIWDHHACHRLSIDLEFVLRVSDSKPNARLRQPTCNSYGQFASSEDLEIGRFRRRRGVKGQDVLCLKKANSISSQVYERPFETKRIEESRTCPAGDPEKSTRSIYWKQWTLHIGRSWRSQPLRLSCLRFSMSRLFRAGRQIQEAYDWKIRFMKMTSAWSRNRLLTD